MWGCWRHQRSRTDWLGGGRGFPAGTSPDSELDQRETEGLKTSFTSAGAAQACDLVPAIPKSGKLEKVPSLNSRPPESGRLFQTSCPCPEVEPCDPRGTEGRFPQGPLVPGRCWLWPGTSPGGALGLQASPGQCAGEAGYAVPGEEQLD